MDNQLVLGYWGIRGLGHTARLLLNYTGATWKDKKYTDRDSWFEQDKKNLGMSFPNLPYLLEGNLKVTESMAVYRYIINRSDKKDLMGKNLQDQGKVDNLTGVFEDIQKAIFGLIFSENYEQEKQKVLEQVKGKFGLVQKFYADNEFSLGYLTLADFLFAQHAYYVRSIDATYYAQFPFLQRLRKAFNQLPQIRSYYQKQDALKQPFMPPYVKVQIKLD